MIFGRRIWRRVGRALAGADAGFCDVPVGEGEPVLQNLGGMGNLTAIPAGAGVDGVMAFDTGPGNVVIDACVARLFGRAFDRGGAIGRRGRVIKSVVDGVLREGYFSALPPKSCGREEFGGAFVDRFISACRSAGGAMRMWWLRLRLDGGVGGGGVPEVCLGASGGECSAG